MQTFFFTRIIWNRTLTYSNWLQSHSKQSRWTAIPTLKLISLFWVYVSATPLLFTWKTVAIVCDYRLEDIILCRPHTFNDLGVIFDGKLSFAEDISKTWLNASKTYGFIVPNSYSSSNVTLKMLFCTFTKWRLENAFVVVALLYFRWKYYWKYS